MIHYYRLHNNLFFTEKKMECLQEISCKKAISSNNSYIYYLVDDDWQKENPFAVLIHPNQISGTEEGISIIQKPKEKEKYFNNFPKWIKEKIYNREVGICNKKYPRWKERLEWKQSKEWNVNLIGLGNVGGTLLIGLKLLGEDIIGKIGIFDTNKKAVLRWEREINQVVDATKKRKLPTVIEIQPEEIFQADIVVFCVSIGVPPPEEKVSDVRMMQLEANSRIINYYAQRARKIGFNGIFAIVSDPVDLLCQSAFLSSNNNKMGELDGRGLSPDQIRGFGLGVMNGRATYYAQKDSTTGKYQESGRVFGPHGQGLVVVDDIENYNQRQSEILTEKVLNANIELRKLGFKPYIAPALSSGALSLLAFMNGDWHYSAGYLGGIFWGSRNRQTPIGVEWEQYNLTSDLFLKIKECYLKLKKTARKLEK